LLRLVFLDVAKTMALGLLVGLPTAFVMSQLLQAFLFEVSPTSPRTFVVAAAALVVAALVAIVGPLRRASKVDPTALIRNV
jgi:predicted lysophospholipase L1 biosynthesis ABC-type transport system permease subunit